MKCATAGLEIGVTCPDGEYQVSVGQTSCDTCTAGHQCSDKALAPVICAAGEILCHH